MGALVDAHCQDFKDAFDDEENGALKLRAQLPNAFLIGVMRRFATLNANQLAKLNQCEFCNGEEYTVDLDECDYHNHKTKKERMACKGDVSAESVSSSNSGDPNTDSSDSD